MAEDDHVTSARAVYDASAERYLEFVGPEINAATEGAIDRAMLEAFVDLVVAQGGVEVADLGCGPGRVAAFLAARGLDAIGIDVSPEMLVRARSAHPDLHFEEGRLDALPLETESVAGAVSWYSIIHAPPHLLDGIVDEMRRVLEPGGHLLLAFQAGDGDAVHRVDAQGSGLPLTSYRHGIADLTARLELAGFDVHGFAQRAPELAHESSPQAFVIARRR